MSSVAGNARPLPIMTVPQVPVNRSWVKEPRPVRNGTGPGRVEMEEVTGSTSVRK
jgi:hypothetical protein